jgi:K+-transporting ATPase KdpF subunit
MPEREAVVHRFSTRFRLISTAPLPATTSCLPHGRSTRCSRHRAVRGADARPHLGAGAGVTVVQGLLLALSVVMFIYLGVAMFKPEWF